MPGFFEACNFKRRKPRVAALSAPKRTLDASELGSSNFKTRSQKVPHLAATPFEQELDSSTLRPCGMGHHR